MTEPSRSINLLVAVSENGVIGRDGHLPWFIPSDLKWFKRLTTGHVVIAGRVTHEEIVKRLGRPLPERDTVVLSRTTNRFAPTVYATSGVNQALRVARGVVGTNERKIYVIGGASVYAAALPYVDRIYLTRVLADVEGDTVFPDALWLPRFVRTGTQEIEPDPRDDHPIRVEIYDRKEADDASPLLSR